MRFLTVERFRVAPAGRVVVLEDEAVPSRYLVPLDEQAVAALTKVKAEYLEDLEFRRANLGMQPYSAASRARLLDVPAIPEQLPDGALPEIDLRRGRQATTRRRAADDV